MNQNHSSKADIVNDRNENVLPQIDDKNESLITIIGLMLVVVLRMFGMTTFRKKKN